MPCLVQTIARWDADASRVRYFASFEGADEEQKWVEVPAEDFDRLTRLFAQEAIDGVCHQIFETMDHVKSTLEDFTAFREGLEKLSVMTRSRADDQEN
jgi:hypothetical protein